MNKAIPYVVAGVLGLGAAWWFLGSSGDAPAPAVEGATDAKPEARKRGGGADAPAGQDGEEGRGKPDPRNPPPEGSLRPLNQAELEHNARKERPFNKHYDHVSSFWRVCAMELAKSQPELARECGQMEEALRGRARQSNDELNAVAAMDAELALVEKLSPVIGNDPTKGPMLEYIRRTAAAVKRGEDPLTVPRPTSENPNPFR